MRLHAATKGRLLLIVAETTGGFVQGKYLQVSVGELFCRHLVHISNFLQPVYRSIESLTADTPKATESAVVVRTTTKDSGNHKGIPLPRFVSGLSQQTPNFVFTARMV